MSRYRRSPHAPHRLDMKPVDPTEQGLSEIMNGVEQVWMSRDFLAALWRQTDGPLRLSVQSTSYDLHGRWKDGITWDQLQDVKEQCLPGTWAVEIYPPTDQVVNVANIRHLWILDEAPTFAWVRKEDGDG